MEDTEKYRFLEPLNERETVSLVRDTATGSILTARIIHAEQVPTYLRMKGVIIPHVPVIHDIVQESENQYIVYADYIEGSNLSDYLQEHGRCTEKFTISVITQLCDGLSSLHLLGIVHRDIKPSNVVIGTDGTAWLIDFDISRIEKKKQARDTTAFGTAGYAAPEQFGFSQSDQRTDLYALGVLMNVLLTGRLPSDQKTTGRLASIIEKCTEMNPDDRYPDADALKDAVYNRESRDSGIRWKDVLHRVPGFRKGRLLYEAIAILLYLTALFLLIEFLILGFRSLQDFILLLFILYNSFFWYLFGFDCFSIRSCISWLEKYRGEWKYVPLSILVALFSLAVSFLVTLILFAVFL